MDTSKNDIPGKSRTLRTQLAVALGLHEPGSEAPWYRSARTSLLLALWCATVAFFGVLQIVETLFVTTSAPRTVLIDAPFIEIPLDPAAVALGHPLPDGVQLAGSSARLSVHGDIIDRLLNLASVLPMTIVILIALILFRRIVVDGRTADPFVSRTTRRLRTIATVIGGGGLLASLISVGSVTAILYRNDLGQDAKVNLNPNGLLWIILVAQLIFGISAVFKEGVRLRAETEGLV